MRTTTALLAPAPGAALAPTTIQRRELRDDDIAVRVTHCGVCFTDVHHLRSTDPEAFPLVPGHEFVGNIVDSCESCRWCASGQENWCEEFPTLTYGGRDRQDGTRTLGGCSGEYVVRESFVHPRPAGLDPAGVAPLLCAGVTVWEPLRAEDVGPGIRVGVVGIGGLGHLAVRLARALGAEVTAITSAPEKAEDAARLGASRTVVSRDGTAMAEAAESLDLIIDTIGSEHDLTPYLRLLDVHGVLYPLGYLGPRTVDSMALMVGRKRVSSSGSAGLARAAELLEFCGRHGLTADVEVVPAAEAAAALERLTRHEAAAESIERRRRDLSCRGAVREAPLDG